MHRPNAIHEGVDKQRSTILRYAACGVALCGLLLRYVLWKVYLYECPFMLPKRGSRLSSGLLSIANTMLLMSDCMHVSCSRIVAFSVDMYLIPELSSRD